MRKGDTKLFKDKQKLYLMITLRKNGWAYTSLAIFFNCDRSSLQSWCNKFMIRPVHEVFSVERIVGDIIHNGMRQSNYYYLDGERINKGKSYAEYLAEYDNKYPHRKNHYFLYS